MNKIIKCILIDLDGTILNSGPDLLDSLNYALERQNLKPINDKVIGKLVGGGAGAMIEKAYSHLGLKLPNNKIDIIINDFLKFYYDNCTNKSSIYPGVIETIKNLKTKYKICICTNKKQRLTERILQKLNIDNLFDIIVGSSSNLKLKPDSEMLSYIIKKLNIITKEAVMIGDSSNDIIPAKNLGIKTIFVTYGYGNLNPELKADYNVNKFSEVIKCLDSKS